MKTLTNIKTTVVDGKVTITADIAEQEFNFPVQQVTIGRHPANNPRWVQHAQISQEAFFVKCKGVGVAFPIEDMIEKVATVVEPRLTSPPVFIPGKSALTVNIVSELKPDLEWQVANQVNGEWAAIPGQTSATLDTTGLTAGQFVRCRASSEAGEAFTPVFKL